MQQIVIFVVAVLVGCAAIEWLSRGVPSPWNWVLRAVAAIVVLLWLTTILFGWS